VIVQSSAINNGEAFTVLPGQEHSWAVPYNASVTLMATDFASGLTFRGWTGPLNGKPFNPATIIIENYSTNITAVFEAAGYSNALGVTLQPLENKIYKQKIVPVNFTLINPNWAYFRLRVNDIRFYLDGKPFYYVETSSVASSSEPKSYSYYLILSTLPEGEHSLYVVAGAHFEQIRALPPTMPGTPLPPQVFRKWLILRLILLPPIISILSPEAKAYNTSDVALKFRVN